MHPHSPAKNVYKTILCYCIKILFSGSLGLVTVDFLAGLPGALAVEERPAETVRQRAANGPPPPKSFRQPFASGYSVPEAFRGLVANG